VDHRNTINYLMPLIHEQVILHYVDLVLLKNRRKKIFSFLLIKILLRSLNKRSIQSSRRIIIRPFSSEIAKLLNIRITLFITFSTERN
jgi:hypothetical protein